ncbi:hypothetical protein [Streptomyces sp. NPDC096132]|uniref:DUF7638 domain-containing protein n=1 Tax=Streptomyces sp. NPDC096132 TaxID=3366075 RepID=UPI003809CAD0
MAQITPAGPDLFIYADGLVDCWGLVTLEKFAEKLRTGWVATEFPEGARASAFEMADWKFAEPDSRLPPELLLAEVRDTIDQLNGPHARASPTRRRACPWADPPGRAEPEPATAATG